MDPMTMEEAMQEYADLEDQLGETECPEGCYVEPDGKCPHGYESYGLRAGLI